MGHVQAIASGGGVAAGTESVVATKALLRASERLGVSNRILGRIIGVWEASISRMGRGTFTLASGEKPFEIALLFIRVFRSLDAVVGGDEAVARAWLRNENTALGGAPLALIQTIPGLIRVLEYLDARRAGV